MLAWLEFILSGFAPCEWKCLGYRQHKIVGRKLTEAKQKCVLAVVISHWTLSPQSSHSMGSPDPELSDTTLFLSVFSLEISKQIFRLYGNKSKTCRPVFRPYGVKWLRNVASKIAQKLMSADVTWSLGFQGKRYKQASQQDTLVTCFIYTSAKQVINSSLRIISISRLTVYKKSSNNCQKTL